MDIESGEKPSTYELVQTDADACNEETYRREVAGHLTDLYGRTREYFPWVVVAMSIGIFASLFSIAAFSIAISNMNTDLNNEISMLRSTMCENLHRQSTNTPLDVLLPKCTTVRIYSCAQRMQLSPESIDARDVRTWAQRSIATGMRIQWPEDARLDECLFVDA